MFTDFKEKKFPFFIIFYMSVNNSQIGGNVITRLNEASPFPPPVFCFVFFFERVKQIKQKKKKVVDVLNEKEARKKVHLC